MLIRELGSGAYSEARLLQRGARSSDEERRWRDVALAVARKTGKRIGLDTATRMAMEADFSRKDEWPKPKAEPARKVDPIDELRRLVDRLPPNPERRGR